MRLIKPPSAADIRRFKLEQEYLETMAKRKAEESAIRKAVARRMGAIIETCARCRGNGIYLDWDASHRNVGAAWPPEYECTDCKGTGEIRRSIK